MIVSSSLLTVPAMISQLACHFFTTEDGRRQIPHFMDNLGIVAELAVEQPWEAFHDARGYRSALPDRDSALDAAVITILKTAGLTRRKKEGRRSSCFTPETTCTGKVSGLAPPYP